MDVSYHVRRRLCNAFDVRANITERELLVTFDDPELLYPPAPVGLGNIHVAFGIHRQCVTVRKITELMAGTAEGGQDLSGSMVERVNLLVAAVHHVHEFLFLVWRETNPPCGAAWVRHGLGSRPDPDVSLELSHLVEHLDAITLPVAHVYQAGVAHGDAMDDLRKHSGIATFGFLLCRLTSPLP